MKEGLNINISEFSLAALLIAVLALGIGYEFRPLPPSPPSPPSRPVEACVTKEPSITIDQTFFIPVPAPKVRVVIPPPKPAPDTDDGDAQPNSEQDPVFRHRTPIITTALQRPLSN